MRHFTDILNPDAHFLITILSTRTDGDGELRRTRREGRSDRMNFKTLDGLKIFQIAGDENRFSKIGGCGNHSVRSASAAWNRFCQRRRMLLSYRKPLGKFLPNIPAVDRTISARCFGLEKFGTDSFIVSSRSSKASTSWNNGLDSIGFIVTKLYHIFTRVTNQLTWEKIMLWYKSIHAPTLTVS